MTVNIVVVLHPGHTMKKSATYSPENTVIPFSCANQAVIATPNPSGSRVQLWRPDVVAFTTKYTTGSN